MLSLSPVICSSSLRKLLVLVFVSMAGAFVPAKGQTEPSCGMGLAELSQEQQDLVTRHSPFGQFYLWRRFFQNADPNDIQSEFWVARLNSSLDLAVYLAERETFEGARELYFLYFEPDFFSNPNTEDYRAWARGTRLDVAYEIALDAVKIFKKLKNKRLENLFIAKAKEIRGRLP